MPQRRNEFDESDVQDCLIHEVFEAHARSNPNAIALTCADQKLSYAQLNGLANQVAHELRSRILMPEERVGLCMQRGIETVVGMLAVLKAGGTYVPLDPTYPAERLAFIRDHSSITTVLTTTHWFADASRLKCPLLIVDCDPRGMDENLDRPKLTCRSLAYVIYTSGSTGIPKGVMIEHHSVLKLVLNSSYAPIGRDDCVAHCASPSFDATTWEVWAPLLNGARLHIVPQSIVLAPTALNHELVQHGVTAMFLTVGLFNNYVEQLTEAFRRLNYLLVGGDTLAPAVIARALTSPSRPRNLVNAYGPTETTTFASTYRIDEVADPTQPLPIGLPIANARICILNESGGRLPAGAAGEICVGGAGVARGYLREPELTAERFIADPSSNVPGARLYRTGDSGRWRADGAIDFLGRRDLQVKIRGFRVELGEIEVALQGYPGVTQALAVVRGESATDRHVVAYVVGDPLWNERSEAFQIREYLKQRMPAYMVPARVVILTEFPLTLNGKVDRRSLPAGSELRQLQQPYVAPRSPTEEAICDVWAQLLKLDQVGVQDDFFELGGDSLLGLALIASVEDVLSVQLSFVSIFECPTVERMSQLVDQLLLQELTTDTGSGTLTRSAT